jgi:uncharacterized membrane protein
MSTLRNLWESLFSSLWFVPGLMTFLALCLAFAAIAVDTALDGSAGWAYGGGPEGARELLSAIASSMITVAGVSFSVMIVALTLASQQFGPRLLRNFMRDTGNQIVLGTFIATFTYCLLVLRTVRSDESDFVPHVSVTLAIVFALASLGVLIYFIHHAAVSIQAPELIAMVAKDLHEGIERLYPEQLGQSSASELEELPDTIEAFETKGHAISTTEAGYLQSVDDDRLMTIAREKDLVVLLKCRPGDFVIEDEEIARARPADRMDGATVEALRGAFIFGSQRTHLQDVEFSLQQLVEVAVRALSPSVNDPFTALNCIDRIAAVLSVLARRSFPSPYRRDADGSLRVVAPRTSFAGILSLAFDPIRQYGRTSVPVNLGLLDAIVKIATRVKRDGDRTALLNQALMIERGSASLPEERDREAVRARFEAALLALQDRAWQEEHARRAAR